MVIFHAFYNIRKKIEGDILVSFHVKIKTLPRFAIAVIEIRNFQF